MWTQQLTCAPFIVTALVIRAVASLSSTYWYSNASSLPLKRWMVIDEEFDPFDLSFVKRLAAVGDSYSAGIGAGDRLGGISQIFDTQSDWHCSRYDHSYPYLVNSDGRLGDPKSRRFEFKSCSGAVIGDVLDKQLPSLSSDQQVIMLSAGGNDAKLTEILNQCVFQWAVFSKSQSTTIKLAASHQYEWAQNFDWDQIAQTCEGQLDLTARIIDGKAFNDDLDRLLTATKAKLSPNGMIYYTGYAKFWAKGLSPLCDQVTWTTWINKLTDYDSPPARLTKDRRQRMNELVDMINAKISAAVARAGPQVTFIDYDHYVGYFKGRFCESGIDEASSESNKRYELMFYKMDGFDPMGTSPMKRGPSELQNGSFEGLMNQMAQITLLANPNAKLSQGASTLGLATSRMRVVADVQRQNFISQILPDGYLRVFHPQISLHRIIANLILFSISNLRRTQLGFPMIPEIAETKSCPYISPASQSASASTQQIALASYINPKVGKDAWNRMIDYPLDKVSVLVANVVNGPDSRPDPEWLNVISRAHKRGKTIIGYVQTGYLGVSVQQFTTRLGSNRLADWVAQIESDVDLWYSLYPGLIQGIFFDEGWNFCGDNNEYAELYRFIVENTKRKYPGAYTVLNPGDSMPPCFEHSADTLMTFEGSYNRYYNDYHLNNWTAADSRKIWHIIYDVPQDKITQVVATARERGAGLLHITPALMPNPYDILPDRQYMKTLLDAVEGGKPLIADRLPNLSTNTVNLRLPKLRVHSTDYSSVTLQWSPFENAKDVRSVSIWDNNLELARLRPDMTSVTIGNLEPGRRSWKFNLRAVGSDDRMRTSPDVVLADTQKLPGNQSIVEIGVLPAKTTTLFHAQFLLPYTFHRIFMTDPSSTCNRPSYRLPHGNTGFVCAHYMVEGETLFRYTGTQKGFGKPDAWAWSPVGARDTVKIERKGYKFIWVVPLGTSTFDTNNFIIQGDGYSPKTEVFVPCPKKWSSRDTSGTSYCNTIGTVEPYKCFNNCVVQTKWCDKAVNTLRRGAASDKKWYETDEAGRELSKAGNCWRGEGPVGGCKIHITGRDTKKQVCTISGDEMWWAYQDIRKIGKCGPCGRKRLENGCEIRVEWEGGCGNQGGSYPRLVDAGYNVSASDAFMDD